MTKHTTIKVAMAVMALSAIALVSETSYSKKNSNSRWEWRFSQDPPPASQSNKTVPKTELDAGATSANESTGCRDAFVMMNQVFDNSSSGGKSRLSVPPLANGQSQNFNCTDVQPQMQNNDGLKVIAGTLTVRCDAGTARLVAANCETEKPKPVETPPPSQPNPPQPSTPPVANPNKEPGCDSQCSKMPTCRITSDYQISKNATGYRTSTAYACDNGMSRVVSSTGYQYCQKTSLLNCDRPSNSYRGK